MSSLAGVDWNTCTRANACRPMEWVGDRRERTEWRWNVDTFNFVFKFGRAWMATRNVEAQNIHIHKHTATRVSRVINYTEFNWVFIGLRSYHSPLRWANRSMRVFRQNEKEMLLLTRSSCAFLLRRRAKRAKASVAWDGRSHNHHNNGVRIICKWTSNWHIRHTAINQRRLDCACRHFFGEIVAGYAHTFHHFRSQIR